MSVLQASLSRSARHRRPSTSTWSWRVRHRHDAYLEWPADRSHGAGRDPRDVHQIGTRRERPVADRATRDWFEYQGTALEPAARVSTTTSADAALSPSARGGGRQSFMDPFRVTPHPKEPTRPTPLGCVGQQRVNRRRAARKTAASGSSCVRERKARARAPYRSLTEPGGRTRAPCRRTSDVGLSGGDVP